MLEIPQESAGDWYRRARETAGKPAPADAGGEPPAKAAPTIGDWYADRTKERAQVLEGRIAEAKAVNLDRAVRVLRMQARIGGSHELIDEVLEEAEANTARQDVDAAGFFRSSPGVARFMSKNKYYAALVQHPGDQAKVQNLEELLSLPRDAWPKPDEVIRKEAEKFGVAKARAYFNRPRMTRAEFNELGLPPGFESTQEDLQAEYPDLAAAEKSFVEEEYRIRRREEDFVSGRARADALESLGRRFTENPLFMLPGWSDVVDYGNAAQALEALQAMAAGKATDDQADFGERYVRLAAAADRRGTTFMAKAASIFSELPKFALEMAATGPAAGSAKGGTQAALRSLFKRAMAGRTRQGLGSAAGIATQSALMLPLMAPAGAARRQMPDAGVDAEGSVQVLPGTGDTPGLAWARAALDTLIEVGTERLGGSVPFKWLDKQANRLLFESWAGKAKGRSYEGFRKLLDAGGVNGILGEIGEEEAGKILRAAGGLEKYQATTLEEFGAQALAFGVLPGGAAVLGGSGRRGFRGTNPEAFRTTAKLVQAMKLVETAPDQAEALFHEIAPDVVHYIPIDAWEKYYSTAVDEKTGAPVDPRMKAAEILGDPAAYDRAVQQGTDLAVPFSRYAVTIARDEKAMNYFALEMRQDPLERNAREAEVEIDRLQKEAEAESRITKRALERLSQREAEIREEALKVARAEARAIRRELEASDLIARFKNEGGRRIYWTAEQGGKNVEELLKSGVPADLIANPEEAARQGPGYATSVDEAAARFDMSSEELLSGLAEAAERRREAEAKASSSEVSEDVLGAVWEREFVRVLEEVTAEEAGGSEAARAAIAKTILRRLRVSGFGASELGHMAELAGSVFRAVGERANVSPAELFRQFGPRVRRATGPGAAASIESSLQPASAAENLIRALMKAGLSREEIQEILRTWGNGGRERAAAAAPEAMKAYEESRETASAAETLVRALVEAGLSREQIQEIGKTWATGGRDRAAAAAPEALKSYESAAGELEQRKKAGKYNDPNQGSLFDAEGNPNPQAVGGAAPAEAPAEESKPAEPEPAPLEAMAAEAKAEGGPLGDVGEQLWYNRRNFYGKGVTWNDIKDENATLKVLSAQKGKVWPRPDYEKLVEEGMHPLVAHVVKQIYDSIAAKAGAGRATSDEDLKLFVDGVGRIREAVFDWAKDIQTLEVDWEDLAGKIAASPYGMGLMEAISVEKPIDRIFPTADGGRSNRFRGNAEYNRLALLLGGNKTVGALNVDFSSLKEAAKAVAEGWPRPREGWEVRYQVSSVPAGTSMVRAGERIRTEAETWSVVERKRSFYGMRKTVADGFATREEAVARAKELATPKGRTRQEDLEVAADPSRTGGVQRPGGLDASPRDLMQEFGFKGVNYGNWVTDAERQSFTNRAYDALADLSEIMGIPRKAVALNGLLGIAFGAQGKGGGAAAHFIAGVNEINLTKTKGAGSLAHEWAHALDHYFAVQAGERYAKATAPFLTHLAIARNEKTNLRPEIAQAFKDIVGAMESKPETEQELKARLEASRAGALRSVERWLKYFRDQLGQAPAGTLAEFDAVAARIRAGELGEGYEKLGKGDFASGVHQAVGEIRRLLKDALGRTPNPDDLRGLDANAQHLSFIIQAQAGTVEHRPQSVKTEYAKAAAEADQGRTGDGAYFSIPTEMFARAFQSYVMDRLADRAQRNDFLTRPQASAEMYKAAGMADRYPRGVEREKINAAFDVLVRDLKTRETQKGVELYQADEAAGDRLGGYLSRELTGDVPLISLYKGANWSTFLHESGHGYLDMMAELAGRDGVGEGLKADFQTLLDWFGVKDLAAWRALSLEEKRPHHEQFARGFERYLMEGKAPSVRLRTAFERFKAWLTWIYKKVDALKVELTPEVRRVMDRLVATEAEIQAAAAEQNVAPLPAGTLGLSGDEEKAYLDRHEGALSASRQQADRSVMDGVRQTLEALLGDDRAAVQEAVEREVGAEPVYLARAALEKGKTPDGKDIEGVPHEKLSRKDITDRFGGEARWKKIRRLTQAKEGMSPERAAERFGFSSGEELLRALETAEPMDAKVARLTNERLLAMKGAHEIEASEIADEAMKALHTDERADILAYELGRLAARLGRRHTPVRLVREHAEKKVREALIRDVRPHEYQRGESRAAAEALDAALKKNLDAVFDAKERELLNHELYRAARARLEEVEKGLVFVRQAQRKAFRELLGRADFLERWEDLAARFEFIPVTRAREEARKGLAEWIRDREASGDSLGEEVLIPEWVRDETFRTNYRDLSGEQFDELLDSFRQLAAMARYNNALAAVEKRETRDDARAHLLSALRENMPSRPPGARTEGDKRFLERLQGLLRQGDASLLKVEQLFEWWDGGRVDGPWHQYLFNTASKAQTAELDYTARITAKISKAVNSMPKNIRKRMHEQIEIPGLGRPLTRRTAVGIALNAGNASNWRKMVRGEGMKRDGLSELQLRAAIDALSKEEIEYVNSVWELLESMWPDVEALYKDLRGIAPPKVKTRPFQAKNGLLKGGYYPVMYEQALSKQGELQAQANIGGLMDEDFVRASLPSSHSKAREEAFAAPVNLDLDMLPAHLAGVIKDLTWRKWMIDANWILNDRAILSAIEEHAGKEYTALLRDWVKRTVNDRNHASLKSLSLWKRIVEGLRFNTMIAGMGFKAATMTSQVSGVGPAIEVVGLDNFREGVSYVLKNRKKAYDEMVELSGEMRHRLETKDRDIRQKLLLLQGKDDLLSQVQDFALRGIGYADLMVSTPTWWGGYFKGLKEYDGDQKLAIESGDRAVRLSQGSGGAKDLSSVQARQDTLMRIFTMYYTPFGALYARLRDIGHDFGKTRNGAAAAARLFWVWIFASTVAELAAGRGPDDDKDESWLAWWTKNQAVYPFLTIPLVRDFASAVMSEYGYQMSPISQVGTTAVGAIRAAVDLADDGSLEVLGKKLLRASGYALGLPTGQLEITGEYLLDLFQGDVTPAGLGEFTHDLLYRRPRSRNRD